MVQPDEFLLDQLIMMGFDPIQASTALVSTNNRSIDAAIEVLYNTPPVTSKVEAPPQNTFSSKPKAPILQKPAKIAKVEKKPVYDSDNSDVEVDSENEPLIDEEMYDALDSHSEMATVLDSAQLQATATAEIERIAAITETSIATAGALLRTFKWNSEKLLESYYDNPDKVSKLAGLASTTTQQTTSVSIAETRDCEICGDSLANNPSSKLDCNHRFCNGCLEQYLTVQINDGKSLNITCMAYKCTSLISDALVKKLVNPAMYSKYQSFVMKSFVEDNPNVKWCPRPGCGNAVKSDTKNLFDAYCSCGYKFWCNEEAHAPALCVMVKSCTHTHSFGYQMHQSRIRMGKLMKMWQKKCKDDSPSRERPNGQQTATQTQNIELENSPSIISAHKSPQCSSAIEKNGGCNHMTCRKCSNEFCWICGAKWAGHTTCNKYVEKDSDKMSMDRAALERYLHYFHRYSVHEQSKKFETALRNAAIAKMESIQNSEESRWIDVQYIDSATEQLIECRRTLKYTYVFAFYLVEGVEKNLFEYLQSELETTTEQLSGGLEAPVGSKEPRQIKDLALLAGKRLQHLLAGVEEMLENKHKLPLISEVLSHMNKIAADTELPTKSIGSTTNVLVEAAAKNTGKTKPTRKSTRK